MARRLKRVSSHELSGKTFAPIDQVESFGVLVDEFVSSIFELEPGEYLITDESDLLDFTPYRVLRYECDLDKNHGALRCRTFGREFGKAGWDPRSDSHETETAVAPNNRWRAP